MGIDIVKLNVQNITNYTVLGAFLAFFGQI